MAIVGRLLLQFLNEKETPMVLAGGLMYGLLSSELKYIKLRQNQNFEILKGVAYVVVKNEFGKGRVKQRFTHQPISFPFKHVLHPRLSKKKPRKSE